jgi:hypothetical protein
LRDAIVISGWTWEAANVPERIALALAHAGARVLYCENPSSVFRRSHRRLVEVHRGIYAFGMKFFGHRLNFNPVLSQIQAKLVARQVIKKAVELGLRDPLFIYPHGPFYAPLCREFKRQGFPLVHICMDYELSEQMEHVRLSDLTLAIPEAAFEELNTQFKGKVRRLPQLALVSAPQLPQGVNELPSELSTIPRPRLAYLGNITARVDVALLREFLVKRPDWHFVHFGAKKQLSLPNEHVLSWRPQKGLEELIPGVDVGFLPYDCSDPKNLHCVPLKIFDYFSRGVPVVSTPIVNASTYHDLVYIGGTTEQLERAVSEALNEPPESPKKARRMVIARDHSIENISGILTSLLDGEIRTNRREGF